MPLNIDTSILGGRNFSALIQGNMKLINGHASTPSIPYDGYWSNDPYTRTDPPKSGLAVKLDGKTDVWLFDLDADPTERNNLAAAKPDVVAKMLARLEELGSTENGYKMPQPNFPHPRSAPFLHNGTWAPWLAHNKVAMDEL